MDDDLEPIAAAPVEMTLTLPKGNRQMRLSALAYRWLREAHGLDAEAKLSITLAAIKGREGHYAIVYDADGLVVDPSNYYASGVALRRLLDHPKEMVRIPVTGNAERGRLEFDLASASLPSQAGGAPAAARPTRSGSEPRQGAADQVAPRPSPPAAQEGAGSEGPAPSAAKKESKTASLRAETEKAAERRATVAPCPQCGAEAPQQGTLYDYNVQPPQPTALVFSCPNGHRFERPASPPVLTDDPSGDGMADRNATSSGPGPEGVAEVSGAQGGGPAGPPPHASDLSDEDVNAIDAILAEDAADDAENEVNPEWLAALHGETE